ncbi:hypothetical protein [Paenibacillus sp. FJAT-26967]|uniref:hypothetical protein n=1 Tax=Paenibacillus sp. FJAT-26967 TaxID=1729690 RepID=UPI0008380C62|nr:hypothetical protein [Paenibacillus sp. FJAT-26967]
MEAWIAFIQERWLLIAAAIIVLLVVISLVKTIIKWVLVIVIVGALLVYGANYKDTLQSVSGAALTEISSQAIKTIQDEAKDAKYTKNPDGTYTVGTKSVKIEGKDGSADVAITFMNRTFNVKADSAIQAFIDQAKKNTGQQ